MARGVAALTCGFVAALTLSCSGSEVPGTSGTTTAAEVPATLRQAQGGPSGEARFVGREVCAGCHGVEAEAFAGSHHDRAMAVATPATVRGRFDGRAVEVGGARFQALAREGRPYLRTAGADGQVADFPVAFAFGTEPLEQYLIPFPDGRFQAAALAWDTRPAAAGGERFFHVYGQDAPQVGDALHWAGPNQTWNSMCAECHSTGVEKGYRPAEDRYETRFAEIDVSCEACHGPSSLHVAWAHEGVSGQDGASAQDGAKGLAVDLGRAEGLQVETCAFCHSRRSPIAPAFAYGRPLTESHLPALLAEHLYFPDGQIEGEVFEYGSFLQSKMHAAGVVCSDCHEPHGARLKAEGNALCGRCHAPAKYDAPGHHHHQAGTTAARCATCHMPARTYMQVDERRDHGFRVPRPDLSVELGIPNACGSCHGEQGAGWAAQAVTRWTGGRPRPPHWAPVLAAGRQGLPGAREALLSLGGDGSQPAIVRATALSLLGRNPGEPATAELTRAAADADPLVRLGTVRALEGDSEGERWRLLEPLLGDSSRAVRIEAARVLAGRPLDQLEPGARAALQRALGDYRAALATNADRAEAQTALGDLEARLGRPVAAEAAYRSARLLDPTWTPAAVNHADLLRAAGRDVEAEALLREALAKDPASAPAHHALGLNLIRQGRRAESLAELRKAAELAPGEPRFSLVLELTLASLEP